MARGAEIRDTLAVYNKSGDMPGHNKHTKSATQQEHAEEAYIAQIFRRKEKGGSPKVWSKIPGNGEQKDEPETKQYLVLPELEQE